MFNLYKNGKNAKRAAKNVQCIHTSIDAGTTLRTCHQDFLMGLYYSEMHLNIKF